MTRDEWRQVKALAADALTVPSDERQAYVASRAGANERLRGEVWSLLESITRSADLYEAAAFSSEAMGAALAAADPAGDSMTGQRIGAYRVIAELGRGGMGTAYFAERDDREYEKRVAIKLIKRGMDTDAILRRFRHERQILADLEHPNIVRLLDGGTTADGRPYFVMEYVEGQPIDAFCASRDLPIAGRLRLFRTICDAVHHAHERRVVHRDLKPGNILVTADGVPKLLDFGIAKLLDVDEGPQTSESTIFARAMTPQYASPEQVRGAPLTPATDVYSLGVLLYELLTGQPPYRVRGRAVDDAERAICDEPPRKPSTVVAAAASDVAKGRELRRQLAGSLDTVVLTALRKDPRHRYPSARALGEEIGRYLDGLPVTAPRDPGGRWRARPLAAAGAACLAILATVAMLVRGSAPAELTPPHAIAVLPFSNTSGNPELDYLSDGITEDIINRLSRASELKVIARDSAYRYKGRAVDPPEIREALGADAILTGRVAQRGSLLTIAAELVDARDRRQLWGQKYERTIGDLQQLQRELAHEIAATLKLGFSDSQSARFSQIHTASAEAYHAYLKGRYFWNKRTPESLQRSVGYFGEALRKDPDFALAYSGLADSYALLTEYHALPPAESYPLVMTAVTRALAIDSSLAEAHISLGYARHFYEWNREAAERAFRQGLALNPSYATGHQWYAEYLSAFGRHDEALAQIRNAQAIDPLSLIVNSVEAYLLYMAGRYDEAIEQCRKVIDMDPNFPEAYEYLKRAYDQTGAYRDAIAARQTRRRLLGATIVETPALRRAANATTAREYWTARLEQETIEAATEGVLPFEMAEILAQTGDTAAALTWLERSCREGEFLTVYIRVAPNLVPLRHEPRYQDLVRRGCRTPR
jgi:eukaryotic-like serine/threonine-protein kinase